jgi:hypothetical protein
MDSPWDVVSEPTWHRSNGRRPPDAPLVLESDHDRAPEASDPSAYDTRLVAPWIAPGQRVSTGSFI